jgi:hypothetical protein
MTGQASSGEARTIREAMRETDATWRQLHYWIQRGWLTSSREDGWTHYLSPDEVHVARVMIWLIDAGLTADRAAVVARAVLIAPGVRVVLNECVAIVYDGTVETGHRS